MKTCILFSVVLLVSCVALSDAQGSNDCPVFCPAVFDPVCGRDAKGTLTTFSNSCKLIEHNRCTNPNNKVVQIYKGECRRS